MKKITLFFITFLTTATVFAQTPQLISYQAVARNGATVLINQQVGLQFTVHDASTGGNILYQESQTVSTNAHGLFSVTIGNGTVSAGAFNTIDWSGSKKYLEVGIDPANGTNYQSLGTTQLVSVPYALYANKSDTAKFVSQNPSWKDYAIYAKLVDHVQTPITPNQWTQLSLSPISQNGSAISLNNSIITLTPGTYYVNGYCLANNTGDFGIALLDGSNNIALRGGFIYAVPAFTNAPLQGVLVVSTTQQYTLQAWGTANGYIGDYANNLSGQNPAASILIQKIN